MLKTTMIGCMDVVHQSATGDGAKIVDKFDGAREESLVLHYCTGDFSSAKLGQRHSAAV